MTTHHAAFWIDHNELRAIALGADGTSFSLLAHLRAHEHVHTHPTKTDGHRVPPDARFFAAVEDLMSGCDAIALFGPSQTKDALIRHLEESHSPMRARIATVAVLDRMTDGELAAHAREAFRAVDRMRGIHVASDARRLS